MLVYFSGGVQKLFKSCDIIVLLFLLQDNESGGHSLLLLKFSSLSGWGPLYFFVWLFPLCYFDAHQRRYQHRDLLMHGNWLCDMSFETRGVFSDCEPNSNSWSSWKLYFAVLETFSMIGSIESNFVGQAGEVIAKSGVSKKPSLIVATSTFTCRIFHDRYPNIYLDCSTWKSFKKHPQYGGTFSSQNHFRLSRCKSCIALSSSSQYSGRHSSVLFFAP